MIILPYLLYYYNLELYKIIFGIFFITMLISIIPLLSSFLIKEVETKEKISGYECGFEPFETARSKFEVKFYLVSILFIIFDLEVIYLFPWILILNPFNILIIFFLIVLIIGFIYEWYKGALDWF